MIVPDVNVLLYAVDETSRPHDVARTWLEQSLSGIETVAFSWSVVIAFLRLSTRPAVFSEPLIPQQAFDLVEGWLSQPSVVVIDPTERHLGVLRGLLDAVGTAGNLVPDAHLAALAIEHGGTIASSDRDFGRFPGLRWTDPLAG